MSSGSHASNCLCDGDSPKLCSMQTGDPVYCRTEALVHQLDAKVKK